MNSYQEGQFSKLKLVIWDLDELFWRGTIDDGDATEILERHITLVKTLTDHGIVNSICSKNDKDKVKAILTEKGIWELFVFPSINWSAKRNRITERLKEMSLREVKSLFIDDNHLNIEEVEYCVPGISIAYPYVVETLLKEVTSSDITIDLTHADSIRHYKRRTDYVIAREIVSSLKSFGATGESVQIDKSEVGFKEQLFHLKHRKEVGRLRDDIHVGVKCILYNVGLLGITYKFHGMLSNMRGWGAEKVSFLPYFSSYATQLDRRCVA